MGFKNAELIRARQDAQDRDDRTTVAELDRQILASQETCTHPTERQRVTRVRQPFAHAGKHVPAGHRMRICIDCSKLLEVLPPASTAVLPEPKQETSPAPVISPRDPTMVELARELWDEDQCSSGWRHYTRAELEDYCRRGAQLADLVLEMNKR